MVCEYQTVIGEISCCLWRYYNLGIRVAVYGVRWDIAKAGTDVPQFSHLV